MTIAPTTSAPPRPLSLVNVVFWQISGLIIGSLIPTSTLAFLPASWLVLVPDGRWSGWVWGALGFVPLTATIGGVVGTIIGASDRNPALGFRRAPSK